MDYSDSEIHSVVAKISPSSVSFMVTEVKSSKPRELNLTQGLLESAYLPNTTIPEGNISKADTNASTSDNIWMPSFVYNGKNSSLSYFNYNTELTNSTFPDFHSMEESSLLSVSTLKNSSLPDISKLEEFLSDSDTNVSGKESYVIHPPTYLNTPEGVLEKNQTDFIKEIEASIDLGNLENAESQGNKLDHIMRTDPDQIREENSNLANRSEYSINNKLLGEHITQGKSNLFEPPIRTQTQGKVELTTVAVTLGRNISSEERKNQGSLEQLEETGTQKSQDQMLGLSTHANKELKFENDTLRNMELTLNTEILKNISPGCVNETQVNKSLSTQNETQKICKPSLETVSLQSHEQLADPPRNQDPTVMVPTQEILNLPEDTVTTEAQKLTVESHIQVENETHWLLEPTTWAETLGKQDPLELTRASLDEIHDLTVDSGNQVNQHPIMGTGSLENPTSILRTGTHVNQTSILSTETQLKQSSLLGVETIVNQTSILRAKTNVNQTSILGTETDVNQEPILGTGSHINQEPVLGTGTHINEELILGTGTHISQEPVLGTGTHINQEPVLGTGTQVNQEPILTMDTQDDSPIFVAAIQSLNSLFGALLFK